jgi:hypothetical protein
MFMQTLVIMVVLLDQHEWSLLVVGFILLIQALQELFVMFQLSSNCCSPHLRCWAQTLD